MYWTPFFVGCRVPNCTWVGIIPWRAHGMSGAGKVFRKKASDCSRWDVGRVFSHNPKNILGDEPFLWCFGNKEHFFMSGNPTQSSKTSSQHLFFQRTAWPPGRVAGSGARPGEGRGRNDFYLVGSHGRLRSIYAPWTSADGGDGGWGQGFLPMEIHGVEIVWRYRMR